MLASASIAKIIDKLSQAPARRGGFKWSDFLEKNDQNIPIGSSSRTVVRRTIAVE